MHMDAEKESMRPDPSIEHVINRRIESFGPNFILALATR